MTARLRTALLASTFGTIVLLAIAFAVRSPHADGDARHAGHMSGAPVTDGLPTLAGEYAFATIAEIVALLDADPDTDWPDVDVPALREHLVDMHHVTVDAMVTARDADGALVYDVRGESPATVASIRRMTGAHAMTMAGGDVRFDVRETEAGAEITVTPGTVEGLARLRALGFHGLMALGDHHRMHHLAIARGTDPH